jgi:hypothetical protein
MMRYRMPPLQLTPTLNCLVALMAPQRNLHLYGLLPASTMSK